MKAIGERSIVEYRVVTDWTGQPDLNYRCFSTWGFLNPLEDINDPTAWTPLTRWETLPNGVFFDPSFPTTAGGQQVGLFEAPENVVSGHSGNIAYRAVRFSPSGSIRSPISNGAVVFRLMEGILGVNGMPSPTNNENWLEFQINAHTGQSRVFLP